VQVFEATETRMLAINVSISNLMVARICAISTVAVRSWNVRT